MSNRFKPLSRQKRERFEEEFEEDMAEDNAGWFDRIRSKLILETPYDYASPISRSEGAPGDLAELVELQRRMNEDGLASLRNTGS